MIRHPIGSSTLPHFTPNKSQWLWKSHAESPKSSQTNPRIGKPFSHWPISPFQPTGRPSKVAGQSVRSAKAAMSCTTTDESMSEVGHHHVPKRPCVECGMT